MTAKNYLQNLWVAGHLALGRATQGMGASPDLGAMDVSRQKA